MAPAKEFYRRELIARSFEGLFLGSGLAVLVKELNRRALRQVEGFGDRTELQFSDLSTLKSVGLGGVCGLALTFFFSNLMPGLKIPETSRLLIRESKGSLVPPSGSLDSGSPSTTIGGAGGAEREEKLR